MLISVITINRNNFEGLRRTVESVFCQSYKYIEYILVDGGSTDGSEKFVFDVKRNHPTDMIVKAISEPDNGIYNAMNKGIKMATSEYVQILNSGDLFVNCHVVERLKIKVDELNHTDIICGNQIKPMPNGKLMRDRNFAGDEITFYNFYRGTINHSSAWIKRSLFVKYGLYDESLKIDSDWKWYMYAIALGDVVPIYVDVDITLFDMTGISETDFELRNKEKREGMMAVLPKSVLRDYDLYKNDIDLMKRVRHYSIFYKFVWFVERCLFQCEKINLRRGITPQK